MGKKRPARTARRQAERAARDLVRDRERLAALEPGGSAERPIEVAASSVIEPRARGLPCPQCGGAYRLDDHQAPSSSLRLVSVTCQRCGTPRRLWFRLGSTQPS